MLTTYPALQRLRRDLRVRPVVASSATMRIVTGGLFMAGAALLLLLTFLPHHSHANVVGERIIAAVAFAVGPFLLALQHRPAWTYPVLNFCGSATITLVVVMTGGGEAAVAVAMLYTLVPLDSFFFFSWLSAMLFQAWALGGVLVVTFGFHVLSVPVAISLMVTQVAAGLVVGWLVRAAGKAELDSLTELPNRRGFDRLLESAVEQAERSGEALALAVLDIDNFKMVNDSHGHLAGDAMLRNATRLWMQRLPCEATLARHGGDEFALLLPGETAAVAAEIADGLRSALADEGHTCSAGTANWGPGASPSALLSQADIALYQAKRGGRNCVHGYQDGDSDEDLRAALEHGQLYVVYQPVVSLQTGAMMAVEALLRWHHPARGVIAPMQFVPRAEATGLIREIGRFVMREACLAAAHWPSHVRVAVNVSGAELLQPDYVDNVRQILAETGLPARRLGIEVTETTIGADSGYAIGVLEDLRALGLCIAVDDFGVGYSSLSRLDRLPVDVLKLDRSFVATIREDGESPLVAAIASLASAVGLETIAEGVEEPHQVRVLRRLGFCAGQGYLFSRPVDAATLARWTSQRIPRPRAAQDELLAPNGS